MSAGLPISKNIGVEIRNAMTSMATSIQSVATNVDMNNQQLQNINKQLTDTFKMQKQMLGNIHGELAAISSTMVTMKTLLEGLASVFVDITSTVGAQQGATGFAQFDPKDVFQGANDPLLNAMILLLEFTAQMLGQLELISENISDVVFFLIGTEFELIKLNQNQKKRLTLSSKKKDETEEGDEDPFSISGIFAGIFNKFIAFDAILKAFEPTLEIFTDLFTIFGDVMAATILPVLQPLNQALIGLMPMFVQMGQVLGGIVAEMLTAFIDVLVQLIPVIEPILEVVLAFMQVALIPLRIILAILSPLLGAMIPHLENFSNFMGGLSNFIIDVANAFIDFINAIDIFNWFPDLQKLEKIDLGTKQEELITLTTELVKLSQDEHDLLVKNLPKRPTGNFAKFIRPPIVSPVAGIVSGGERHIGE